MIKNLIMNLAKDVQSLLYKLGLIADYVVENATNGDWTYQKWNSGKVIADYSSAINLSPTTAWGTLYFSGDKTTVNFPTGLFIASPTVVGTVGNSSHMMGMSFYTVSNTTATEFYIYCSKSVSNITVQIRLIVIGRWQ